MLITLVVAMKHRARSSRTKVNGWDNEVATAVLKAILVKVAMIIVCLQGMIMNIECYHGEGQND